jgi:Family of unknown function (DUF5996)
METIVAASWPEMPYAAGKDACATLQLWTQMVGKVRLSLTPWINHSWHVTLRVSAHKFEGGLDVAVLAERTQFV